VMLRAFADSSREGALRTLTGEGQIHAAGYLDDPGIAHRFAAPSGPLLAVLNGPAVGAWSARIRLPAVAQSEYRTRPVTLVGVDPAEERKVSDLPGEVTQGRYLAGSDDTGVVIGRDLATRLKTSLGRRIILMSQAADGHLAEQAFVVVGVFKSQAAVEDEFVFTGRTPVRTALGLGDDISEIAFDAAPKTPIGVAVAALRRAGAPLEVKSWMELSPLAYTIEQISGAYVGVWLMIMFVLMAIGIVNTQLMAVFERTREFGLLQALGMRPGQIVLQVSVESATLIAIGVLAGVGMMLATLLPFAGGFDLGFLAPGAEMAGVGGVLYPKLNPGGAMALCLIVWVMGVLAALWPARTAARTQPVVAMAQL
jgi:ABC-type lipoprotein release transport system permease subunit